MTEPKGVSEHIEDLKREASERLDRPGINDANRIHGAVAFFLGGLRVHPETAADADAAGETLRRSVNNGATVDDVRELISTYPWS